MLGSHLVQEALENTGSFHRQGPWDANGLLKNNCRNVREEKDSVGREEELHGAPSVGGGELSRTVLRF